MADVFAEVSTCITASMGIVGIMISRGLEMGSEHHAHEADSHHEVVEAAGSPDGHAAHEAEEHHEDGHDEHGDATHLAGALVGICSGLILLFGHILNIRASRRCRQDACE